MSIGIIIQARKGSTRLPNKMILPFYEKKGVLEILLARIKSTIEVPVCIATTKNPIDNEIENIAKNNKALIFRGEENNVLSRFIKAADKYGFNKIIRVCADNPFLDIGYLKTMIKEFENSKFDYYAFYTNSGLPSILTHYGFWAEGVSLEALKKIEKKTRDKIYLEHATSYIYKNAKEFSINKNKIENKIEGAKDIRLTLDTKEDFLLLKEIYREINNNRIEFTAKKIIDFINKNDRWKSIMKKNIKNNSKKMDRE